MTLLISIWLTSNCLFNLGKNEQERIVTINHVRFFEDSTRKVGFEDILAGVDTLFAYNRNFEPANYNPESAYWIAFNFCLDDNENEYLIEFFDQTIDSLSIYLKKDGGSFVHWKFGDQLPFSSKPFRHKNFHIPLQGAGQYHIYARISNRHYADIRLAIKSIDIFLNYALNEYYLYGIFFGMILIISLYNVTIYSAIGEIKYLYYTFYILSVGLFAMCLDGIAYQYLWKSSPDWNEIAHGVALFSVIFWAIVFSKVFLRLKSRAPVLNRVLNIVLILRSAVFLYALEIDHSVFNYRQIEIIPLSLIFFGSIVAYTRGYKPARFFIVAYGFLFLGFLIKALLMISVIPLKIISNSKSLQIITYYSLHISFLFEMLFLSLALSDRIRILKETKDRAQYRIIRQHEASIRYKDQLNAQLEEKIQHRTAQLAEKNSMLLETNQKLEIQKQDIAKINSMLDLDNWKLRNNIKSLQKERLLNKSLSYNEFCQVFSDRKKSLQFLANHKWKNGYNCKKCGNSKYLNGGAPFARRCSKCGYNETATSGSLFHAIKFPLEKALYLLYLFLNDESVSVHEMADTLNLRQNTVSAFNKKIRIHAEQNGIGELNFFDELDAQK